jgi:adenylyltransferase/sulfurtransferase
MIVGVGGLGCAVASVLTEARVARLVLVDDDIVDETNLHRQILYDSADVGKDKLDIARSRLLEAAPGALSIDLVRSRLLPENARELIRSADLVVEGADNYATKFLVADAAALEARPVVHGAALGWRATAWAVGAAGKPCYRCLFEDIPLGEAQNCSSAGVMGPVVGFGGALMAELALEALTGAPRVGGLLDYDGLTDRLREVPIAAREDCPLCGATQSIFDVEEQRYTRQSCAT